MTDCAFIDVSGGVDYDAYTLAIAHKVSERLVIDVVPGAFDPQQATKGSRPKR